MSFLRRLAAAAVAVLSVFTVITPAFAVRILHLSDIHVDLEYTIGAPTNCVLGSTGIGCCRSDDIPTDPRGYAEPWGDPNCDSPLPLLNSTLHWIIDNLPPVDVVVMTGDFVDHKDLTQTWALNRHTITVTSQTIQNAFGNGSTAPVIIPVLGNHDTYPVDQLYPDVTAPEILSDIKYIWNDWLLSDDGRRTFANCGYYTGLVPRLGAGVRVLVVNSLYYDTVNLAVQVDPSADFCGQKQFITNTVQNASAHNETLFVLGHIPPGSGSCADSFAQFLSGVVASYPGTALYHLWGHTHTSEIRLYRNATAPVGAMFITPSLVPGSQHTPAFRVYTFNETSRVLLNFEEYHCPLSNSTTFPGCVRVYDTRSYYNLTDLTPGSVIDLVRRMSNDSGLFNLYNTMIDYPGGGACTGTCYNNTLCDVNYVVAKDHSACTSAGVLSSELSYWTLLTLLVVVTLYEL